MGKAQFQEELDNKHSWIHLFVCTLYSRSLRGKDNSL